MRKGNARSLHIYLVEVFINDPGSVLIKPGNRDHESCPCPVVLGTGFERCHANL